VTALAAGCARGQVSAADARNFSLPGLRHPGQTIALSGYANRPVIISFFASWCPPCQRDTAVLARFNRAYHRQATIIGIDSSDRRPTALRLLRRSRARFAVAADPSLATANAYGAPGLPATYFLNARHKVVAKVLGPITWQQLLGGLAQLNDPGAPVPPSPPG
jgi:thiol-disulfide isomerase/thioredoxin